MLQPIAQWADSVIGQLEFNTHCLKFESQLPSIHPQILKNVDAFAQMIQEISPPANSSLWPCVVWPTRLVVIPFDLVSFFTEKKKNKKVWSKFCI